MCLIMLKPENVTFPKSEIENVLSFNSDGFGYMFLDDGRVVTSRGLDVDIDYVMNIFKQNIKKDTFYHFRKRTHGDISLDMCHPYKVLDKVQDGMDLYMMHNGTIPSFGNTNKGDSDTKDFVENLLRPILVRNPDILFNENFQKHMLEKAIGAWSKLAFLGSDGRQLIVREDWGKASKRHGCWVSNDNYFTRSSTYTSPATTNYPSHNYTAPRRTYDYTQTPTNTANKGPSSYAGNTNSNSKGYGTTQITKDELRMLTRAELFILVNEEPTEATNILFDLINS